MGNGAECGGGGSPGVGGASMCGDGGSAEVLGEVPIMMVSVVVPGMRRRRWERCWHFKPPVEAGSPMA